MGHKKWGLIAPKTSIQSIRTSKIPADSQEDKSKNNKLQGNYKRSEAISNELGHP